MMNAMMQLYPEVRPVNDPASIYDELLLPAGGDRPYVAVNMVSTLDGKATMGGRVKPIGSQLDRRLMLKLRTAADAVLRGAGTVRSNPVFPGVPADDVALRQRKGLGDQPRLVIVSATLDLPWEKGFAVDAPEPPIVLTTERAGAARLRAARVHALVHVLGAERVDVAAGLKLLQAEYGIQRILSEGGPSLNWVFLEAGCLDELFWTVAPKMAGSAEDLTMVEGPRALGPHRFHLVSAYLHEDEWFLRYRRAALQA